MTRLDQEADIISALRETDGYFTIYWAMQTQYRQAAIERLEARGVIVPDIELPFPSRHVRIKA